MKNKGRSALIFRFELYAILVAVVLVVFVVILAVVLVVIFLCVCKKCHVQRKKRYCCCLINIMWFVLTVKTYT